MSKNLNPTPEELEAFIRRAGFHFGWTNLESAARRMAEAAVIEIKTARSYTSMNTTNGVSETLSVDELRDRLVAISSAIAEEDAPSAQSILRDTLSVLAAIETSTNTVRKIAAVAHYGGLINLSEADALIAIRKLTLGSINFKDHKEATEALRAALPPKVKVM
jgi:hypothetical protein